MFRMNRRVVLEKLSHVSFEENDGRLTMQDELRDIKYEINYVTYSICRKIDGEKSLGEIAVSIAELFKTEVKEIEQDIYNVSIYLLQNNVVLKKASLKYYFIKLYYVLSFIRAEDNLSGIT